MCGGRQVWNMFQYHHHSFMNTNGANCTGGRSNSVIFVVKVDSHLTWQHQCNETAKTYFISHSQHWQLMSPMWCVLAPEWGCGRRIVLKWTLLRYIDQDKAVVKRVGGTLVCLLAEKLWNNAKFPIREPCKVTTVCSLSANWILPL